MSKEIPSAQTDPIYTTLWLLLQTYFPTSQTSDVFHSLQGNSKIGHVWASSTGSSSQRCICLPSYAALCSGGNKSVDFVVLALELLAGKEVFGKFYPSLHVV